MTEDDRIIMKTIIDTKKYWYQVKQNSPGVYKDDGDHHKMYQKFYNKTCDWCMKTVDREAKKCCFCHEIFEDADLQRSQMIEEYKVFYERHSELEKLSKLAKKRWLNSLDPPDYTVPLKGMSECAPFMSSDYWYNRYRNMLLYAIQTGNSGLFLRDEELESARLWFEANQNNLEEESESERRSRDLAKVKMIKK